MSEELLTEFFKLRQKVHDYFDYQEDWVSIPLEDARDCFWHLQQDDDGHGRVTFWDTKPTVEAVINGDMFSNEIYTQRFLRKWVYRAEKYTMICVDTRTDGNKYLQIFDNDKEISPSKDLLDALKKWSHI